MNSRHQVNDQPTFARYAHRYAAAGFSVFPLACGSKKPLLNGHGLKEATTDPRKIAEWSERYPCANIGVAAGKVSGVTVIDVDPLHHGFETERGFRAQGKVWPNTPVSRTRSGGRHIWMAYHPGLTTGTNRIGQEIDIRNDGGYVVVAPSIVDGKKYEWLTKERIKLARVPQWVLDHFEADQAAREDDLAERAKNTVRVDPAKLRDIERRRYAGMAAKHLPRYAADLTAKCKPGRNTQLYTACGWMKPYVEIGVIPEDVVRSAFEDACHRNGLVKENGMRDVRRTMNRAFRDARDRLPDLSKLEDRPYRRAA